MGGWYVYLLVDVVGLASDNFLGSSTVAPEHSADE